MTTAMEGMALGLLSADVHRANAEASSLRSRVAELERQLSEAQDQNEALTKALSESKLDTLYSDRLAAAGFIFMSSFAQSLPCLARDVRDKFLFQVRDMTLRGIRAQDQYISQNFGADATKIEPLFAKQKEWTELGFNAESIK